MRRRSMLIAGAGMAALAGCGSAPVSPASVAAAHTPAGTVTALLGTTSCSEFASYVTRDSLPMMEGCTSQDLSDARLRRVIHVNHTQISRYGASVTLSVNSSVETIDLVRQDRRWKVSLRGVLIPDNPFAFPASWAPWIVPDCTTRPIPNGTSTSCRYPVPEAGEIRGTFIAVGGPAGAPNVPQIGMVTLTEMTTKKTYTVRSGADGRFTISVPPGTYTAVGLTPEFQVSNREAPCGSVGAASVTAGRTVPLTIVCERI